VLVKRKDSGDEPGDISHFQSLMTALSATVGTGNIAGVATAIAAAFQEGIPGGALVVTIGLVMFAYSTILGWSYYGEKSIEYLFGEAARQTLPLYFYHHRRRGGGGQA
jgi:Na+/alanine symporter